MGKEESLHPAPPNIQREAQTCGAPLDFGNNTYLVHCDSFTERPEKLPVLSGIQNKRKFCHRFRLIRWCLMCQW